ncbi:Fanconi anemia group M protein isoform X2 [Nannospalax galili]|uniref:Fanconi anemia group M protein isoform X2 n=1 Tax=Nannospalax galili TaxID=1026970 RepID=UPI00111BD18E|nr:Fanconi anemia group M protein isoform X2 [Nannospalax galili]
MSARQRTLFQTWGPSLVLGTDARRCGSGAQPPQGPESGPAGSSTAAEARPEADDEVLLVAVYEAERQLRVEDGGFCAAAGALWIYPTNRPVRDYQLRISRSALFCNTLVCLPTGLGKTFIAAVVMYNFYRWFPSGKVVFMAPTKPLVTQQMEACYQVMGIPQSHMAEMTGSTQAVSRKETWSSKRVLFLTPQVMVNDLTRGVCPAADIRCLVVDEAHKALGNYAYCQVVRELVKYTNHFRILALSATPGSDIKAVQQVITNLLIGKIELCSEDSPDILPYSHERRVEKIIVPLGKELVAIQKTYVQILETFASSLIEKNVLMRRDIPSLTKYQIILARDQFRKNPSPNIKGIQQGVIEGEFAICISLYHGFELLQQMGMRSLYFFLSGIMDGTKGMTRAKNALNRNEDFMKLYNHLESLFVHVHGTSASDGPACQRAKHTTEKKCHETRVMIFSSFRDSVQEIAEMLVQYRPMIRVMTFVGHASGKSTKGFTQKEQLEVVRQFRDGGYNTLVSTCVGEEGLDIGEVDLIICFDAQKSPIRLIQRMGRTGRKRQGRIVVILAEGREERTYNQSQSNKKNIYKAISGNRQVLHFYQGSPRMIPDKINPELHKMFITPGVYEREKPSRSRKFSLFSSKDGMKPSNSYKDGLLSEEEFKLWNRLYRLRDSDTIKEITLPQVHFPSLQDKENRPTQEPTTGIHQLSLSEWRVWQDHPLPTHQVDHSDRCYHFISVMQMMEGMRHEEDKCSYELKIKPYLQMEDISSTFCTPRCGYNSVANGLSITHKKSSFAQKVNQDSSLLVSESDGQCAELFTETHTKCTKITSLMEKASKEMEEDWPDTENDNAGCSGSGRHPPVEAVSQVDPLSDRRMAGTSRVAATDTVKEDVVTHPDSLLMECQVTDKSSSFARKSLDSGYSSFNDEKSVSSHWFLPFEEELYADRTDGQCDDCSSLTEEVVANVERFLAHSPPPLSQLSDLEHEITEIFELENVSCVPYAVHVENPKFPSLVSNSAVNSPQNLELDSLKLVNHSSEKRLVTTEETISHEPYFCDSDKIHNDTKNENLVCSNDTQIHIDPTKNLVERKSRNDDSDVPAPTDQEESLLLFEDDIEEFNDVSLSPFKSDYKPLLVSDKNLVSEMAPVSQFLISDELLFVDDSEPEDQIIGDTESWKSHEELKEKRGGWKSDEHSFDCSRDLFSVTFDLGFCGSESDDEIIKHASDTINSKGVDDVPGRPSDTKEMKNASDALDLPRDHTEAFTSGTTPMPTTVHMQSPHSAHFTLGAAKSKALTSTHFSPFFLPMQEKVMSTPISKSNRLNLCSKKREGLLKTPDSKKEKASVQSFKETWSSSFGLGFPNKISDQLSLPQSSHCTEDEHLSSESEDDEIFLRKSKKTKRNVLKSPEDQKNSEVDSPIHAVKKSRVLRKELSSSDEGENFHRPCPQMEDFKSCNRNAGRGFKVQKRPSYVKNIARKFLDDEAELSEEDAECVSSDEDESENEQDSSLLDFVNDQTQLSQAVNDSEMRAIYMKSIRSPLMSNKYKMVHQKYNDLNIFSQIPEQDETYLEDSFCVDEEESCKSQSGGEEICVDFNLTEDSFTNENIRYKTRRAVKLKQMSVNQNCMQSKKKLSRIILPDDDSSEEENSVKDRKESSPEGSPRTNKHKQQDQYCNLGPSGSSFQSKVLSNSAVNQSPTQGQQTVLNLVNTVPPVLNFKPQSRKKLKSTSLSCTSVESRTEHGKCPVQLKVDDLEDHGTSGTPCSNSPPHLAEAHTALRLPQAGKRACILVDSREITSGLEVISSLRTVHGLQVEVCPLNGCDYIVSNRMVVERRSQSEMLSNANKNKFIDQIQHLQSMFQRICVIVEKDREKAGDTSRIFRRTKCYDSLLTTLVGAGIRILFSSGQEETADLLKELSLVEQRKNVGIHVPAMLNSSKCETLQFYLSIPNISYITALNMCHQFSSVKKMANSSPEEISTYAQVNPQKAAEIYGYIHYIFDMQMLPNDLNQGRLKSDS